MEKANLLGMRSVIYPVDDVETSKGWWTRTLGIEPYFDEPFYTGYNIGGFELGLFPAGVKENGPVTYWGVDDIDISFLHFTQNGAVVVRGIEEVGAGIKVAILRSATGEIFGLIFNPHFQVA